MGEMYLYSNHWILSLQAYDQGSLEPSSSTTYSEQSEAQAEESSAALEAASLYWYRGINPGLISQGRAIEGKELVLTKMYKQESKHCMYRIIKQENVQDLDQARNTSSRYVGTETTSSRRSILRSVSLTATSADEGDAAHQANTEPMNHR